MTTNCRGRLPYLMFFLMAAAGIAAAFLSYRLAFWVVLAGIPAVLTAFWIRLKKRTGGLERELETLRVSRGESESRQWTQSALARIAASVRNAESEEEFNDRLLAELERLLAFGAAIVYFPTGENGTLRIASTRGIEPGDIGASGDDAPGGFAREAVRTLTPITINNVPQSYFRIKSGLRETVPATLMLIPVVSAGTAIACIEAAFFRKPESRETALAAEIPETIAPYLASLGKDLRIREMSALLDAATTGIGIIQNRKILGENRKLDELFGYAAGELAGKPVSAWFPPEIDWDDLSAECNSSLARGGLFRKELRMLRRNGNRFWGRLKISILDKTPEGYRMACVVEDITRERIASRTLSVAKETAEAATKAKSEFLANMSHEIRTPLNAIINISRIALAMDQKSSPTDYLQKIEASGKRLLDIVDDILDFSKIEAGKVVLEKEPFSLEDMLALVAGIINEKAGVKKLELVFDIGSDVPRNLVGDGHRLEQVLLNFGSNAVKFTERGEICIGVKVREKAANSVQLDFSIRDTGIGLEKDQIERIFNSFEQGDMSATRKYGGTGLGLAISKRLVDLMGGEIRVESELGKGSTFGFSVRLGIDRNKQADAMPGNVLGACRALVVDDNESSRLIMRGILKTMTTDTVMADSGAEAVALAEAARKEGKPFRLVFLDWKMPGMDGIETARALMALSAKDRDPEDKRLHIIMQTAFDSSGIPATAGNAGIEAILTKPVTPSQVLDTCLRVLGNQARAEPPKPIRPESIDERLSAIAGAKVLLVEDNEINQEVAKAMLSDAGMDTDIADNGAIALEILDRKKYDLVIMDMQMPVMDGLTATRKIRERPDMAGMPVIAMTANATKQDRQTCLDAGMNDVIVKPIEPYKLRAALVAWIPPRAGPLKEKPA